jgi:hypothetical protein
MTMRYLKIVLLTFLVYAATAQAQNVRSAVSVTGSDANPCTPALPCRTISYALTQTILGGDVIALTSGGYGPFTVNQAVTVDVAPGVYAGVTATTGNAITVNGSASDIVTLRGLTMNSFGAPTGILNATGAHLYIERCQLFGFSSFGVLAFFDTTITDITVRNCFEGIKIDNAGAAVKATIVRAFVAGGGFTGIMNVGYPMGIHAQRNADVSVSHAVVTDYYNGFVASDGGTLNVADSVATHNYTGVWATPTLILGGSGSMVRASAVTATDNYFGFYRDPMSSFETWQNNRVYGNSFQNVYAFGPLTPITQR